MIHSSFNKILAGSFFSALILVGQAAPAAAAGKKEKCYGVALKGHNDCAVPEIGSSCAGTATEDYQKSAFKLVPEGTCVSMKTPHGHGLLKPAKS